MAAAVDGITENFYTEFNSNLKLLSQQKMSYLLPTVTVGQHSGKQASACDFLSAFDLEEKTTKLGDTPFEEYEMSRRWVLPTSFRKGIGIDPVDLLKSLEDPQGQIAAAMVAAYNRRVDESIITALGGNGLSGEAGPTTSVALPSTQKVVAGASNLTVSKLRDAQEILLENQVEAENMYCAITPAMHKNLLAETEVGSIDYNEVRALVPGKVGFYMGFNFIIVPSTRGLTAAYAYDKNAVHFGVWQDLQVRGDIRTDKDMAHQVYCSATVGAARVEEERVVEIAVA